MAAILKSSPLARLTYLSVFQLCVEPWQKISILLSRLLQLRSDHLCHDLQTLFCWIIQVNQTEEKGSLRPNVAIVWTYPDPNKPLTINNSSEEQTWYYITSIATNLDTKFNPLSEALYQWDEAMLWVLLV